LIYRSWLFVPGNQERKIKNALNLSADVIIIDLEDAVPADEKKSAKNIVENLLSKHENEKIFIRINGQQKELAEEELKSIVKLRPKGIMLPKSEDAFGIIEFDNLVKELETSANITMGTVKFVPLIESALGVLNSREIASASSRNICLAFGAIDFTLDIGAELTPSGSELLMARSMLVLAAKVAGLTVVDTVYPHIKDDDGLYQETSFIKSLGMFGKLVIHPNQIGIVNDIFSPTEEEILSAQKIIAAFKEAEDQGIGAIQVNGKFIDYPVAARAKRVLEIAGLF